MKHAAQNAAAENSMVASSVAFVHKHCMHMATELESLSDEALMERVQQSDEHAFALLVRRHTQRFYACAYRFLQHKSETQDIVQECFIALWQKPQHFQLGKKTRFTTWFYKVIMHRCLEHNKKKLTPAQHTHEIVSHHANPHEEMQQTQQQTMLEAALLALPARQQMALNLCVYEGLSNKDAAEVIGVRVKALESLLMRAKAQLKQQLAQGANYG